VTQSKKYSTPERSSDRNKTISSGNTADFLGLLNRGDRLQEAHSVQQQVKIIDLKDQNIRTKLMQSLLELA
jgi:hypothetical protein